MIFNDFSVNEQNVSDGEKGCDRAKLAFDCLKDNAPKVSIPHFIAMTSLIGLSASFQVWR